MISSKKSSLLTSKMQLWRWKEQVERDGSDRGKYNMMIGSQKQEKVSSMLLSRHYKNQGWQHLFSSLHQGLPSRHLKDGSKISRRNTKRLIAYQEWVYCVELVLLPQF
jgi:hypothetical protein